MVQKILELEVSSLFPIDLTEAAFIAQRSDTGGIIVHLNSELANSESAKSNKFVSRGSFPLAAVEATNLFGWQCVHTIEGNKQGSELEQFLQATLVGVGDDQDVISRASALRECQNASKQEWRELTSNILTLILRDLGFQSVRVTDSNSYRVEGVLSEAQRARLYRALSSAPEGREQTFLDGGFVEFFDASSDGWVRSNTFKRIGSVVVLQPCQEGRITLEISSPLFGDRIRCRGLLQHVLMGFQEGNLVDLPWFASSPVFHPKIADGHEHVSPFSIRTKKRLENRLFPTAYSIIDYHSGSAEKFAGHVLGFDITCPCFLSDYERLSRSPPITRARLAKDQSSIKSWTSVYERWLRRDLMQPYKREKAIELAKRTSFSSFGYRQILIAVALELAKPSNSKSQEIVSAGTKLLQDTLDVSNFSGAALVEHAETELARLRDHFQSTIRCDDLKVLSDNLCLMKSAICNQPNDSGPSSQFFSKSRAFFMDLGSVYFAWLAASVTGPLKAHLLILWLLHGEKGLRQCFEDIVRRRRDRSTPVSLPFSINYFE